MIENLVPALALTFLAGLATGLGSLVSYFVPRPDMRYLSVSLGFATGVMIFVAFVDLFCGAKETIGLARADVFFLIGMLTVYFLDKVVPHCHMDGQADTHCDRLYRGGIMMTLGIAIHNLPEGLAVALTSLADLRLGIPIAIAIAIHNIPEGVACSVPLYCATGDRRKSCLYSFLAGMAEPLGAIIAILVLLPFLNDFVLAASIAFVSGIMVFICFDELIPIANSYGDEHLTNIGLIAGIFVMMIALAAFH
ncbi:MAG TPA: zinc transporter ZupT [Methanothrix sp.]|nr:zinc transporter ZupT [Methanothrix sp.]